jgi:hypothetical protein
MLVSRDGLLTKANDNPAPFDVASQQRRVTLRQANSIWFESDSLRYTYTYVNGQFQPSAVFTRISSRGTA